MSTCVLVGASEFNEEHFVKASRENKFSYVVAVDAGYTPLKKLGKRPNIVIGDFDSLGEVPSGVRVARYSAFKDKSDMELALKRVRTKGYKEIYIYGALGGRLDHTLANLQLFARYSEYGMKVTAIGLHEAVTFVTGPDVFEIEAVESGTISVFSMSDRSTGVFERGLLYGLEDATITNRSTLGLSNEFTGSAVMIGVERGTLAIFMPV